MKGVGRSIARRRIIARSVDLLLCILLFALPRVGSILAVCLALGMDALPGGSPGKRLMHLEVVRADGKRPIALSASVVRNLPVAMAMLLASLDGVLGWLAAIAVALVTMVFEGSLVFGDVRGQRAFDILGATIVRERQPWGNEDDLGGEAEAGDGEER